MSSPPPLPPERRVPVVPVMPRLATDDGGGRGGGSGSVAGISPSIVIIAVIIVVMLIASISIHCFIRRLCRSSAASSSPLPVVIHPAQPASTAVAAVPSRGSDRGKAEAEAAEAEKLIEQLPLFTLESPLAAVPKSSRDCAVCQSPFAGDDVLRLLPACCHAFHSRCVDPWLRSNPSCPLCRSSIALPHPPLADLRSVSMRLELGSISSRRASSGAGDGRRSYPLPGGRDGEYVVEEELEVVLRNPKEEKPNQFGPTAHVLAAAAGGEPSRQVERGASSGSTSFNSARLSERWSNRWSSRWSGRWSSRYDAGSVTAAATAQWWWDLDGGSSAVTASQRREAEEGSSFFGFVRWLTGAY